MSKSIPVDEPRSGRSLEVSHGQRHEMVAVAAYLRAARRGFAPGRELEDWLEAEAAIDQLLANMSKAGVTRAEYERLGLRNALRLWVE